MKRTLQEVSSLTDKQKLALLGIMVIGYIFAYLLIRP